MTYELLRRPCRSLLSRGHLAAVLTAVLALGAPAAHAGIIGINTPSSSVATINFDDTNSNGPPLGITNTGPSVTSWNGSLVSLPLTTDPNTLDQASGNISASFVPSGNVYALNFSSILLTQPLTGTTGFAELIYTFQVEFQLDGAGLPAGNPVYSPVFNLSGTVQTGGFATFNGVVNYRGTVVPGTIQTLHIHQYGAGWFTPGPFTASIPGNPLGQTTPALVPGTTLILDGWLRFMVDPATIQGYSSTIPEPGTWALALSGAALALVGRWRRRR